MTLIIYSVYQFNKGNRGLGVMVLAISAVSSGISETLVGHSARKIYRFFLPNDKKVIRQALTQGTPFAFSVHEDQFYRL